MYKVNHFTGQPVFNQILKLIPEALVMRLSVKYNTDHYCKSFKTHPHLVAMLFSVFQRCTSLREVVTGMQAWMERLKHLGIKTYPKRSTLADANKRRDCRFFEALFHELIKLHHKIVLPDSRSFGKIDHRLYLIDSTTIDLFSDVMGGAGISKEDGKRKGGVKAHVMVNAAHEIPNIVYLTEAKENDRVFMNKISVPQGSILVFDKGYIKYSQWQRWTEQGIYWVTRLSNIAFFKVLVKYTLTEKEIQSGIKSDEKILLGRGTSSSTEIITARRIVYYDKDKKRYFEFVTNHYSFSATHIADLYKKRWQIETLFKSIKQNFQLKYFLGDNPNAIQIQIWCSLIADLLIKIIQNAVKKRNWSFSNLRSMIRMHLGTYVHLISFLKAPEQALKQKMIEHMPQLLIPFNTG